MAYLSFGQATNDAMRQAMLADERVIVMGLDIRWGGSFGQFRGLYDEFGDRVIDMPISESIIVAACVGSAATGMRPVASMSFVEFTLGAFDELVNQAAKFRYMFGGQVSVPMVLRAADGVIKSAAAQHSESIEALFAHIPGLKVVAPSTPSDAKGLLIESIFDDNPVIYLENKRIQPIKEEVPDGFYRIPLGKAVVRRPGKDVTILAYSGMAINAIQACQVLADEHGIDAELIDLRTIVPLDFECIAKSVGKTRRAVVCHEGWVAGGFGAEVASRITEELFGVLEAPVGRVGAKNAHIPFAPVLERAVVPAAEEIVEAARHAVAYTRPAAGKPPTRSRAKVAG
jgi:pyruvate dehydrogenase E1 component beta subunit